MGAQRAYRRPELEGQRMWPIRGFENYLAFYFPTDYGVDVTRVLCATRDIKRKCMGGLALTCPQGSYTVGSARSPRGLA